MVVMERLLMVIILRVRNALLSIVMPWSRTVIKKIPTPEWYWDFCCFCVYIKFNSDLPGSLK